MNKPIIVIENKDQQKALKEDMLYKSIDSYILGDDFPDGYDEARIISIAKLKIHPKEDWFKSLKFINCTKLTVSSNVASFIEAIQLSDKVEALELSSSNTKSFQFPKGQTFEFIKSFESYETKCTINKATFPKLDELALNLSGSRKQLEALKSLKELKKLSVGPLANCELFEYLELPSLTSLNIFSGSTNNLSEIKNLSKSLKTVRLKNLSSLENLNDLSMLKELQEVEVSYCAKLQSIESLCSLKKLNKVTIGQCKGITKTDIDQLESKLQLKIKTW